MRSELSRWPLAALVLLLWGRRAWADDVSGWGFTYPDAAGLTFYENDQVAVSWVTNFTSAHLLAFCWIGSDLTEMMNNSVSGGNSSYPVPINFTTTCDDCWFNLRNDDPNGYPDGFNSIAFNLSANERSQTTLGLQGSATTTLALAVTKTEFIEAPATSTGSSSSSNSEGSGGLSSGAKAGIGIGVALGVLGVAAFGASYYIVKRKKAGYTSPPPAPPSEKDGESVAMGTMVKQAPPQELDTPAPIPEIDSEIPRQELPG